MGGQDRLLAMQGWVEEWVSIASRVEHPTGGLS
jgi:hypothetical protein